MVIGVMIGGGWSLHAVPPLSKWEVTVYWGAHWTWQERNMRYDPKYSLPVPFMDEVGREAIGTEAIIEGFLMNQGYPMWWVGKAPTRQFGVMVKWREGWSMGLHCQRRNWWYSRQRNDDAILYFGMLGNVALVVGREVWRSEKGRWRVDVQGGLIGRFGKMSRWIGGYNYEGEERVSVGGIGMLVGGRAEYTVWRWFRLYGGISFRQMLMGRGRIYYPWNMDVNYGVAVRLKRSKQ